MTEDRIQMPGRKMDRWEENLQPPTMGRTIQTIYKMEIQHRHRITNQRKNNYQNRMEHEKENTTRFSPGTGTRSSTPNNTMRAGQNQNR